jgi:hypothetical protein
VTSNTNPPELKLGQRVLHGGLKALQSDMTHMDSLSPKIQEVMEFQIRLVVKLKLENFLSPESMLD